MFCNFLLLNTVSTVKTIRIEQYNAAMLMPDYNVKLQNNGNVFINFIFTKISINHSVQCQRALQAQLKMDVSHFTPITLTLIA